MSEMNDAPGKGLSGSVIALIAAVAVLALAVVVVDLLGNAGANRWRRYADKLRSGGLPLTLEEIDAQRLAIPDEQNGALVIESLADELKAMHAALPYDVRRKLLVLGIPEADFFEGFPRYTVEPSRQFVAEHSDILEKLEALRNRPHGRFTIERVNDLLGTPKFEHVLPVRWAAKLIYLDAIIHLVDGDTEASASAVLWLHPLAATLHDEPYLISRLHQMSVDSLAIQMLEGTLLAGELEEDTLLLLDASFAARLTDSTMKWAWLGERAMLTGFFEDLAGGKLPPSIPVGGLDYLPELLIRQSQRRFAEMMTWLVEAGDPRETVEAAKRIEAEIRTMPTMQRITQILAKILVPSFERAAILHQRLLASMRCARAVIAAERYRLETGAWPDSLDALVPAFLEGNPVDPFNGEPLRLARTADGIVIYAVGENLADDGGIVAPTANLRYGPDVGFRLFRRDRRGLALTDEPYDEQD